jgi:hypothetical protein
LILHALQLTLGDFLGGVEFAFVGAAVAILFVALEARKERRQTIRLQRREFKVADTKHYAAIGSAPLSRHYGEGR